MDYEKTFKPKLRELFAAHGRTPANEAAVAVIWDRVKTMPDAFMVWAAQEIADYPALPGNPGLELAKVLFPRWYAQNKKLQAHVSCCPDCDTATPGFFTAWQRLDNGDLHRFMCKCCHSGKEFAKMQPTTRQLARSRGWVVMPAGYTNVFAFEWKLRMGDIPLAAASDGGAYIDAALAGEGEVRREHMDELEAMGF